MVSAGNTLVPAELATAAATPRRHRRSSGCYLCPSALSRLFSDTRTLPDRFPLLPLDEKPSRLHGGGAADVVAALEPLAVERHHQRELLGADFVNLDGGGSGFHGVEPMSLIL